VAAVCREPVSGRGSLFNRERTGNFLDFGVLFGAVTLEIAIGIGMLLEQFPRTRSREFFGENRDLISPEEGITGKTRLCWNGLSPI
jgi:hypothetical protein